MNLGPRALRPSSRAFQDGSLCYFSIKENKRLVLLDGIKISGAKASESGVSTCGVYNTLLVQHAKKVAE